MRTKVTEQGLLIPKQLLGDAIDVEIRKEHNAIIVILHVPADPILKLGTQPITDVSDASYNHDHYLYSLNS